MSMGVPSVDTIRDLLSYDPETGALSWKVTRTFTARAGSVAGTLHKSGYLNLKVMGRRLSSHRVAWAIYYGAWPDGEIDHINCDRADNRISNMRLATRQQNAANTRIGRQNTSGFKGVTWHKQTRKWQAQIKTDGVSFYLGLFDDVNEAKASYDKAALEKSQQFARSA